jgi:hypothetical protein
MKFKTEIRYITTITQKHSIDLRASTLGHARAILVHKIWLGLNTSFAVPPPLILPISAFRIGMDQVCMIQFVDLFASISSFCCLRFVVFAAGQFNDFSSHS